MQIIKNRQIISNPWLLDLESSEHEYQNGHAEKIQHFVQPTIVSIDFWLSHQAQLIKSEVSIGVYLNPDDEPEALAESLPFIPLIALLFNAITEGRGYSQAMELRHQLNYEGEIRAIGASVDNLAMMERCGINAFQLSDENNIESALSYFTEIDTVYRFN